MFKPSTWRHVRNDPLASYWRHVQDGEGVTVFYMDGRDSWRWVYDGDFDDADYPDPESAMHAAEGALNL